MAKNKNWVSYKELKAKVTIEQILRRYGLWDTLKPSGQSLVGCCPIHHGTNPRQFTVNPDKNIFNCFGDCQKGGNILDLVAGLEGCEIKDAALKIKDWFLVGGVDHSKPTRREAEKKPARGGLSDTDLASPAGKLVREEEEGSAPVSEAELVENKPLTFRLKTVPEHQFFAERRISPDTIEHFGLGFCSKGMMAGRIAIPINNERGELVAYCGRAVTAEDAELMKYKFPPDFKKAAVVYNLDQQADGVKTLIVVESFLSVYRLYQAGFEAVVTCLGSSLSEQQADLILDRLEPTGQVLLMLDADEAGRKGTEHAMSLLSRRLFVKELDISSLAKKPHLAREEELASFLAHYFQ